MGLCSLLFLPDPWVHVLMTHPCVQSDCWRPLRLPAILVGDSRLGGISTTVSAYETLSTRGYDVPAIAMAGGPLAASNSEAIQQHVRADTRVFTLEQPLPAMPAEVTAG